MYRIFFSSKDISSDKILISDSALIHHIKDVLRLKIGDKVAACDESGAIYDSVIESFTNSNMALSIEKIKKADLTKNNMIAVACAIPKKSKFDDVVDKLTQLGVDRIIPLKTERVIVKLDKRKELQRTERWKKVALSASQQSQRNFLPIIEPIMSLEEVLVDSDGYDLKLIPVLIGERKTLKQALSDRIPGKVIIFIGPEGDFTPDELELARRFSCIPVTLGDSVLRVETAAVAVASFLKFYL